MTVQRALVVAVGTVVVAAAAWHLAVRDVHAAIDRAVTDLINGATT